MRRRRSRAPRPPLVPDVPLGGLVVDARLHLLDRQVLDRDDVPVTTLDDVDLVDRDTRDPDLRPGGTPVVDAILTGAVLPTRVFGGRPPVSRLMRVPWALVNHVGTVVKLGASGEDLECTWTERWVRDRVIGRIPGGRHDPD